MTDDGIEEIYLLAEAALQNGQNFFRTHIFPVRLTDDNLERHADDEWISFWRNLRAGYDAFEQHRSPPNIEVESGLYVVR